MRQWLSLKFAAAYLTRQIGTQYMHYNFCRIHKTLRVTLAMTAGGTDRVWDVKDCCFG